MSLSTYTERFERFAATLPAAEQQQRQAQFARFLSSGFPTRALEEWRYTDLSTYADRDYSLGEALPSNVASECLADAERLVYVNGVLNTELSTTSRWHAAVDAPKTLRDGLIALNAAFARGGLNLQLPKNERLAAPLQVLLVSRAESTAVMSHQCHRIELGENAEATVLLQFVGNGGERLATHVIDITLAAGAKLQLYRIQDEGSGATLITQVQVQQARDSQLRALTVDLGDAFVRHDFSTDLAGPGAGAEISGLYAPRGTAHIDNHTRAVHSAPHCRSRSHYRGIIDERARAVFNGKVLVQPDAQKTDSEQRIANLLLSRRAEVNAKPELEIYADDVKCAHGATVGQLDETALGYLRSRGIPKDAARALLLRAFAVEILDRITWPALAARVAAGMNLPSEMPLASLDEVTA